MRTLPFIYLSGLSLIFLSSSWVKADQQCRSQIEQSTPTARFIINANGTVTDSQTHITWMRCALGQTWNGQTCTGKAREFSWQEARDAVAELNSDNFGEPNNWRLPYVPELASIVERKCFQPRINLSVFPATPGQNFWTGMERKGSPGQAYAINFGKGGVMPAKKEAMGPIRLMKDGPNGKWWKMKNVSDNGGTGHTEKR